MRNVDVADGYNESLVEASRRQSLDLDNREHVVADCKAYIEALTDQLNTKTEELERLVNSSLLQGTDEEIVGLQVILVLFILEIVSNQAS